MRGRGGFSNVEGGGGRGALGEEDEDVTSRETCLQTPSHPAAHSDQSLERHFIPGCE